VEKASKRSRETKERNPATSAGPEIEDSAATAALDKERNPANSARPEIEDSAATAALDNQTEADLGINKRESESNGVPLEGR
jgi:hypothetical protein